MSAFGAIQRSVGHYECSFSCPNFSIYLNISSISPAILRQISSLPSLFSPTIVCRRLKTDGRRANLRSLYNGQGGQRINSGATATILGTAPCTAIPGRGTAQDASIPIKAASDGLQSPARFSTSSGRKRRSPHAPSSFYPSDRSQSPSIGFSGTPPGQRFRTPHLPAYSINGGQGASSVTCSTNGRRSPLGNSSQSPAEDSSPTDRQPRCLNENWSPSTDLAVLNERIAILQRSALEFEFDAGHGCRYDTEEADWILSRNDDVIEQGIREAGQELEGEMITKLEGWVQEDIDTKGEEIRQEIEGEVEEQVEQQTEKALANISAIAAEVRQLRRDTQQRLKDQDQLSAKVVRQVLGGVARIVSTEVTKMSAKVAIIEVGENSAKRQLDGFELAVEDILDKFAHETTQDEMFRIFNVLQTKPMSAALYNVCGARSQVDLQRGLVEEWKRGS
ncbi:hypothetical protein QBC32DRAFT_108570 [Pseudoneurospora amorphoporcata]|uniref:Uncharacterized protein n=1 Tax=Pseudoneurospora amorphoporcata TaxID=241081 RepID=A0AAN6P2L6_9PEZI|nr:hypothetical protein QBC32DRAFT_108570 [Pseudoneurospora amorphoporcata]